MKFGLQVYSFTWPGGPEAIGPTLARAVRTADDVGFDSIWVMDHFWQIGAPDSELQPMLEGLGEAAQAGSTSPLAQLGGLLGSKAVAQRVGLGERLEARGSEVDV